jgi:MFS transporter, FSR family, fosmidomycin resistance protein
VFADELAGGVQGAALPEIQHGLGLSYAGVGLLASLPIMVGGILELPLGFFSQRRVAVLCGGAVFVLSLGGAAFARSLPQLLACFIAFYPASGAFVSLTQAGLMDAFPQRRAQVMARWDLAGDAGAVAGPALLVAVFWADGDWRAAYLVLAGLSAIVWMGVWRRGPVGDEHVSRSRLRDVAAALRETGAARWLALLQVADLLVDVTTGFVAVYLVDVAHASPSVAAIAVAIRLAAALGGDAALVIVLERVSDITALRLSAVAASLLYPAFLLAPGLPLKLTALAAVSAVTAWWYPILNARLYGALPGRSSMAVTLTTAASLAGGLGPLAIGFAAGRVGLAWALGGLVIVPVLVLAGTRAEKSARG